MLGAGFPQTPFKIFTLESIFMLLFSKKASIRQMLYSLSLKKKQALKHRCSSAVEQEKTSINTNIKKENKTFCPLFQK